MEIKNFTENEIKSVKAVKLGKKQAKVVMGKGFCWAIINHVLSRKYGRGEEVTLAECKYYITNDRHLHIIITGKEETAKEPVWNEGLGYAKHYGK